MSLAPITPQRKRRNTFGRLLLEITLTMIFIMILTFSPGKNHNDSYRLVEVRDKKISENSGPDHSFKSAIIKITEQGYVYKGKVFDGIDALLEKMRKEKIQTVVVVSQNKKERGLFNALYKEKGVEIRVGI